MKCFKLLLYLINIFLLKRDCLQVNEALNEGLSCVFPRGYLISVHFLLVHIIEWLMGRFSVPSEVARFEHMVWTLHNSNWEAIFRRILAWGSWSTSIFIINPSESTLNLFLSSIIYIVQSVTCYWWEFYCYCSLLGFYERR